MKGLNSTRAAIPVIGATLLLPLIYVGGVYDFTRWPRLIVLESATLLMFALWWARNAAHTRTPSRRITVPLLAFVLWQILSLIWAYNPVEALIRVNQLLTMCLFAYSCAWLLDERAIHHVMMAAGISGVMVAVICICQYWGLAFERIPSVGQPSATFGYRNYLATYLIVVIPITTAGYVSEKSRLQLAYGAATALLLGALLCTRTRGAWAGLAAALILFVLGMIATRNPANILHGWTARRVVGGVTILVVAATIGLTSPQMTKTGKFGFDEQKSDAVTAVRSAFSISSSRGRTTVWTNTLGMIADNPILGVGLGGWQFTYPEYDRGLSVTTNVAPQRPHNDPVWILAETGLVGLGLYLALMLSTLQVAFSAWRSQAPSRDYTIALGLSVSAYIVHSCFSYPLERVASTGLVFFAIGAIAALNPDTESPRKSIPHWAAAVAILVLSASLLFTWRRMDFDRHYSAAIEAWNRQDWSSVRQKASSAVAIGPFDFRAYQLLGASNQSLGDPIGAEAAYRTSFRYHPNEGHLPLADLLASQGKYSEARVHYTAEAKLYPNQIKPLMGVAEMSRQLEDWAEVLRSANTVLAVEETHSPARRLVADALEASGDAKGAIATYLRILESSPVDPDGHFAFAEFLSRQSDLEGAEVAYGEAIRLAPNRSRYYNNLGAMLNRASKPEGAVRAFRDAIEHDETYARAYRNLGDLLEKTGDISGAIEAYLGFAEHWKGNPEFLKWTNERIAILRGSR